LDRDFRCLLLVYFERADSAQRAVRAFFSDGPDYSEISRFLSQIWCLLVCDPRRRHCGFGGLKVFQALS